jgi:hypothetical protein
MVNWIMINDLTGLRFAKSAKAIIEMLAPIYNWCQNKGTDYASLNPRQRYKPNHTCWRHPDNYRDLIGAKN